MNLKQLGKGLTLIVGMALWAGCEYWETESETTTDTPTPNPTTPTTNDTPATVALPTNPKVPASISGTSSELWYFSYKDADNTFRIRWPTYFATSCGTASYTLVNGLRATFRSYDTDGGARRPSYTLPGPASRLNGTVTCILVNNAGTPVAWFRANADTVSQGTLP